jgi:hypothetical protein
MKPESRIAAKQRIGSLAWRYTGSITKTTYTRNCYKTDMHKSRAPDCLTTTYCTAVTDICGSAVWSWLHIALLLPRILRWLLHLWIICALLLQTIMKSSMTSRLHNLMHRFIYNILRPLIPHTITTQINRCGIVCICAPSCRINRCSTTVSIVLRTVKSTTVVLSRVFVRQTVKTTAVVLSCVFVRQTVETTAVVLSCVFVRQTVETTAVVLSYVFVRQTVETTAVVLSCVFVRRIVDRIMLLKGTVIKSSI